MRKYNFEKGHWNTPEKQRYRTACIINIFEQYFKMKQIPKGLYYWSICGTNSNNGCQSDGVEIDQMIDSNLIKENQFVGVDKNKKIITDNKKAWTKAIWKHGDFSEILHRYGKKYPPMLIHADTTLMLYNTAGILNDIVSFVEDTNKPAMIILNVVAKRWIDKKERNVLELEKILKTIPLKNGWANNETIYQYSGGIKNSQAKMDALLLFYNPQQKGI